MKDLFFWAAEYRTFDFEEHKVSGVTEHCINLRADIKTEGENLIKKIKRYVARHYNVNEGEVIVTSLSRLTNLCD